MKNRGAIFYSVFFVSCLFYGLSESHADDASLPIFGDTSQQKKKVEAAEKIEERREAAEREKRKEAQEAKQKEVEKAKAKDEKLIEKLTLPEDATRQFAVKQILVKGNTLISTEELLKDLPLIYNSSNKPLEQAESRYLYDFRILKDIINQPGLDRKISAKTIQGFTQYLLSVYQSSGYAGIYVYVPSEVITGDKKLQDQILPVAIIEAQVSNVSVNYYDPDQNKLEEGYLLKSMLDEWSPVKAGEVVTNEKELEDFVNLLNENPDRYVSAKVVKGDEEKTIGIEYDIYEANPWHYFIQVDNAGTSDRKWSPRIGLINTNLTGRDDTLTVTSQIPVDKNFEDNYSVFGSYNFPLFTPRLRLNLYAARTEFDVDAPGNIDFVGNGKMWGGDLRFNAAQIEGWFFDLTGSLKHEESKVTPSLFPQFLGSDLDIDTWGLGIRIHRSDDMTKTSFGFNRTQSCGGSNIAAFNKARTGADPDFIILNFSASHQRFLDKDKIQRLLGSFNYKRTNTRLVPAKMSVFGGLYTVRGYEESDTVADDGALWSVQYEYDMVKYNEAMDLAKTEDEKKPFLRKFAPLAFFDYARARIKDPLAGEIGDTTIYSVGMGIIVELGDNFNGGIFYGIPLRDTAATDKGNGRVGVNLVLKW